MNVKVVQLDTGNHLTVHFLFVLIHIQYLIFLNLNSHFAILVIISSYAFSLDLWEGFDNSGNRLLSNAGLAYVGGACQTNRYSVNEYSKSTTLAHELGHKLVIIKGHSLVASI